MHSKCSSNNYYRFFWACGKVVGVVSVVVEVGGGVYFFGS